MRERRAAEPAVPVPQLFGEIKELGYSRSLNLLYRYITRGRAEGRSARRHATPSCSAPTHPPRQAA
ncbi:hypothetical protein Msi02_00170 [Microbispora siamensis]|uniref:Transposase n=1 Tax=Microbispora siamensis TaxID=564413 RepID=A0ABQ4GCW0_9ACTN|nr:hypothetical protein Msi02_00170 [Microbispora siamensis]